MIVLVIVVAGWHLPFNRKVNLS